MKLFSYDDMCLRPKYSTLPSRDAGDTSVDFLGYKFKLPVVPANMLDVISWDLAHGLSINDYFYIMHRFNGANAIGEKAPGYVYEVCKFTSISVGVRDEDKAFINQLEYAPNFITIDVAHGHHKLVSEMVKFIRDRFKPKNYDDDELMFVKPKPNIIAGNVATADGYKFLCDLGVDAVKVGIGGGSICTTKNKTGFHLPTAYSVWECAQTNLDVPIIADGGAKDFGDVAKALTLGATMVMSGGWFASCIDSPAKIENGKKIYRGSTSYEAKGQRKHIEGRTLELSEGTTYPERLEEIRQAICSSISYAGGTNLEAFNTVNWDLL